MNSGSRYTLTLVTKVLSVGNITHPVEVTTTTPDSNESNNKANNTTVAIEECDLEIIKSSDKSVYHVGDKMHWIIEVVNHGPCTAKDTWVSDILPSGLKFISYTSSRGSYDKATGKWSIGDLKKGEKVTLDILCKVLKAGSITNDANVTCSVNDTDLSNNYDNATVKVIENKTPGPEPEPKPPVPDTPEPKVPVHPTMHATGNPIAYLIVALFVILGSFWSRNKKQ